MQHNDIKNNIEALRAHITMQRAPLASQQPAVAHILAASKTQSADAILRALDAGILCFGENRVQEAQEKWLEIKALHPETQLHMIGTLQTNKAENAVALFDVIQTLDRTKLADALAKAEKKLNIKRHYLIQVNTGEELQKAGVIPKEADNFISYCREEAKLEVTGLMCIPPANANPAPHFALLRTIAQRHGLTELSMGMSADYLLAARLGATMVRIGTGVFGGRKQ